MLSKKWNEKKEQENMNEPVLSTPFIQSEMLAESYISDIAVLKDLLKQGKLEECLFVLEQIETAMQVTLAMGERYDAEVIN